ncbi:hypothetical protein [Gramella sp. MAR_2010_147]|uniref:hypothetical protein n=1 Tax=Gramella sp. MAR_2010_147 TaxID=1250205 RepID=UPI0012FD78EE|nr:hypothetical protein [Gramella sp. MAR_2010_147]
MKEIFFVALLLLILGFTIKMGLHIYHSNLSLIAKTIWIIFLISAPLLGATLYFISDYGRTQ